MVVLTSFTQPTDGIRHRQNNTTVYVNDNNLGKGTLFIAESRLSWVSDSGNGFSLEYPHISLHAVSRDLSAFPQECLFLMIDTALGDEETNNGNGESDNGDEDGSDGETTEIRLVPDDRGMLDAMFHAMNACQALHPDPEDSFSDEDFYEDADDEIPMEETDYRMAGLRIENTDGRPHIGRGVAAAEDMEEVEEDRVVGTLGILGGRAGGTSGIWGGTAVGAVGDSTLAAGGSILGGEAAEAGGSTLVGEGRAAGGNTLGVEEAGGSTSAAVGGSTLGGEGRAGGNQVEGRWSEWGSILAGGSQAEGRWAEWGRVAGDSPVVAGWAGGTLGTLGGRGVDRVVDMAGDRVVGTSDTLGDLGVAGRVRDMGRGGRPFSSGSIWHQGRTALPPGARSPHTAQKNHHNFDDAEN